MHFIYLGADHAGFSLKNTLYDALRLQGFIVEDLGAEHLDPEDDYPVFAERVASAVQRHPESVGILLCGSAEGMCMAANRFLGIRAGIGFSQESARAMRSDDDANILCIPARLTLQDHPLLIAETFLTTPFLHEDRHVRRIAEFS